MRASPLDRLPHRLGQGALQPAPEEEVGVVLVRELRRILPDVTLTWTSTAAALTYTSTRANRCSGVVFARSGIATFSTRMPPGVFPSREPKCECPWKTTAAP